MNIQILDCTLRDGGYVNNWEFGESNIKSIISKLVEAEINIIECGFLTDEPFSKNFSLFESVEAIAEVIYPKDKNTMYVAMLQFGDVEIELRKISNYQDGFVDGIRIIFQQDDIEKAVKTGIALKEKGYKIFFQPMKTGNYTEDELTNLIEQLNAINPYAFYIVDTFGSMYKKDLLRLFTLADNNLNQGIRIGFHAHNNLQLAFSNAHELMTYKTKREIIIDSSVSGMGRGAGNLQTEVLASTLNDNIKSGYKIGGLLNIYDQFLSEIFKKRPWGYSLPYFLSATNNCHPDYATYLSGKENISVVDIDFLLGQLPDDKKSVFDKVLIEKMYAALTFRPA